MPILVMYDGDPNIAMELAEEKNLQFPILHDPDYSLFDRWNPDRETPSTTMIRRGNIVHSIDVIWHTALIEELVEYN